MVFEDFKGNLDIPSLSIDVDNLIFIQFLVDNRQRYSFRLFL